MATLTVGNGKTYSTIAAAYAAMANSGDTIEIYDNSSYGLRKYAEANAIVWTKAGTIKGMVAFGQSMVGNHKTNRTIDFGNGDTIYGGGTLTIENLFFNQQAFYLHANAGTVIFKNCMFDLSFAGFIDGYTAFDHNGAIYQFENCVFLEASQTSGAIYFAAGRGTNAVVRLYNCAIVNVQGYAAQVTAGQGASFDIRNCVVLGNGAYADCWALNSQDAATCDYNATMGTGALGAHDITGLTWAQFGGYRDGWDIQPTSTLYQAGAPISGVTLDCLGRTRNASNPSIGPFEGPAADFPTAAHVTANDTTNGTTGAVALAKVMADAGAGGTLSLDNVLETAGGNYHDPETSEVKLNARVGVAPRVGSYSAEATAPSAPTLAITDNHDGSITATVAGDAGVTNVLKYKLANASAWSSGGSRVGNGTIAKTGLTVGARYDFIVLSDGGGYYSLPSSEVTLTLSDGTAQSYIITLAELVKDEINANIEFNGSPVTAVRDYMTFVKLQDLDDLLILVTPQSEDMGPQARRKDGQEYLIDVAVLQKVDSKAEADALLKLLDDIYIHFQRYTASGYSCMAAVENPIYSPEAMQLEKRFVSKITLTFKSFK